MKPETVNKKRPLVFIGVGIFNTLLDFGFYTFLTSKVFKSGSDIILAGLISGTFAMIIAFLAHGFITWRGSHIDHKTLLRFFLYTGFGLWIVRPLLLSQFIKIHSLYIWAKHTADKIGIHFSYNFVANTGAFALMLLIVLSYNFYVYEKYVFKFKPTHIGQDNHSRS